jgi:hypothetical protein
LAAAFGAAVLDAGFAAADFAAAGLAAAGFPAAFAAGLFMSIPFLIQQYKQYISFMQFLLALSQMRRDTGK